MSHLALPTPHSKLHTRHFTLYNLYFTLNTLHLTLCTLHCALHITPHLCSQPTSITPISPALQFFAASKYFCLSKIKGASGSNGACTSGFNVQVGWLEEKTWPRHVCGQMEPFWLRPAPAHDGHQPSHFKMTLQGLQCNKLGWYLRQLSILMIVWLQLYAQQSEDVTKIRATAPKNAALKINNQAWCRLMHYFAPLQVWKVSQLPSKISVMELCIRKTMLPTWTCTWTFLNLIWEPSGTCPEPSRTGLMNDAGAISEPSGTWLYKKQEPFATHFGKRVN